jgi:predicted amino acid-binding ACT domain protein
MHQRNKLIGELKRNKTDREGQLNLFLIKMNKLKSDREALKKEIAEKKAELDKDIRIVEN